MRNVNQLICREKQRDRLLAGACACMVETRGYQQAWAVLCDGRESPALWAQTGVSDCWPGLVDRLRRGVVHPACNNLSARQG